MGQVAKTQISSLRQGFELEDATGTGTIGREKVMSIIKGAGMKAERGQLEWILDNIMFRGASSSSSSSSSSPPPASPSSSSPKSSSSSPSSRVEKERGGGQRRVHTGRRVGGHAGLEGEDEAESGERSGRSGLTGFSEGDVGVWDGTFTTAYSMSQSFAAVGLAVLGTQRVAVKWMGGGGGERDADKTTSAGGGGVGESQKSKHSKDILGKQLARATEEGVENRSGKGAARGKKAKKKEAQVRE